MKSSFHWKKKFDCIYCQHIFFSFINVVYAGPVYTDCERPPTIHHGKAELSVDEDGIVVTALYSCDAGYQLNGQAAVNCNTDSDVWEGNLPVCKLGIWIFHRELFRNK